MSDETTSDSALRPATDNAGTELGAAMLTLWERDASSAIAPSRARARAEQADRLVAEAQAILDEELPCGEGVSPGAEAQRAKNRADFRYKRAATLARDVYGDSIKHESTVTVNVVSFDLAALLPTPRPLEAPLVVPVLPATTEATKPDC